MALITNIQSKPLKVISKHSAVECSYTVISLDDEKLLQLDTYGSTERAIPGKKSQSLRFSKEAIQQLKRIFQENGF